MSVGTWDPNRDKEAPEYIDVAQLRRFMEFAAADRLGELATGLSPADRTEGARLMQLTPASWAIAEDFADEEITHLVRFFTVAEMELPGWAAGKKSPVIPLVKVLKERGVFNADLRKWIKSTSDNRYLPYGSVL